MPKPVSKRSSETCGVTLANARWNPKKKHTSKRGNPILSRKERQNSRKFNGILFTLHSKTSDIKIGKKRASRLRKEGLNVRILVNKTELLIYIKKKSKKKSKKSKK